MFHMSLNVFDHQSCSNLIIKIQQDNNQQIQLYIPPNAIKHLPLETRNTLLLPKELLKDSETDQSW